MGSTPPLPLNLAALSAFNFHEDNRSTPPAWDSDALAVVRWLSERVKADSSDPEFTGLLQMLCRRNRILDILLDVEIPSADAEAIAAAAARLDSQFDIKLAERIKDQDPLKVERALQLVKASGDARRIVASITPVLRHRDPRLRSKAAMVLSSQLGAGLRDQLLTDMDSRVRANLLEGLWGVRSESARALMRAARQDAHHRVRVNALVGLYYLGEPGALESLTSLASHKTAEFRRAAAWAMGKIADPRFTPVLATLVRDASIFVRHTALRAQSQMASSPSLPLVAELVGIAPPPGNSR
jgi:hypothetical protein